MFRVAAAFRNICHGQGVSQKYLMKPVTASVKKCAVGTHLNCRMNGFWQALVAASVTIFCFTAHTNNGQVSYID